MAELQHDVGDLKEQWYGTWKDGERIPGIKEWFVAAKASKTSNDRNRSLILTAIATSIIAPILVGLVLLYASAHVVGH